VGKQKLRILKNYFQTAKKKNEDGKKKKAHKNLCTGSICSCILMMTSVMYRLKFP